LLLSPGSPRMQAGLLGADELIDLPPEYDIHRYEMDVNKIKSQLMSLFYPEAIIFFFALGASIRGHTRAVFLVGYLAALVCLGLKSVFLNPLIQKMASARGINDRFFEPTRERRCLSFRLLWIWTGLAMLRCSQAIVDANAATEIFANWSPLASERFQDIMSSSGYAILGSVPLPKYQVGLVVFIHVLQIAALWWQLSKVTDCADKMVRIYIDRHNGGEEWRVRENEMWHYLANSANTANCNDVEMLLNSFVAATYPRDVQGLQIDRDEFYPPRYADPFRWFVRDLVKGNLVAFFKIIAFFSVYDSTDESQKFIILLPIFQTIFVYTVSLCGTLFMCSSRHRGFRWVVMSFLQVLQSFIIGYFLLLLYKGMKGCESHMSSFYLGCIDP